MKKNKRQKDAAIETMLRVPNDETGRAFLDQLRKYKIGGTRVWARGRGPRAQHSEAVYGKTANGEPRRRGFDQQLPQEYATHLAVYIWKTNFVCIPRENYEGVQKHLLDLQKLETDKKWDKLHEKLQEPQVEIQTLLELWKPRKIKL